MEIFSSKIKILLISSQKKVFLIFREMELSSLNRKKLLIFQEGTFWARKIKKDNSEKISYILGNGTF